MSIIKKTKNYLIKKLLDDKNSVPRGLFELNQYFRYYDHINFDFKKEGDLIVGVSNDFRHGAIVTSGKTEEELDRNIKDAILTSFNIPSSYAKEAKIQRVGKERKEYALA